MPYCKQLVHFLSRPGMSKLWPMGQIWPVACLCSICELRIDLPYDPAIALLGIYPKDTDAMKRRDTCTLMFIAAMSTIAKLWKEPWCPSIDEWIKKVWYIYTVEYYSAIRNNKYAPFASTWMELEGIMLSEMSQS